MIYKARLEDGIIHSLGILRLLSYNSDRCGSYQTCSTTIRLVDHREEEEGHARPMARNN